jgi:dTDP-glucose pyrophosphorylase
MQIVIPMAGKGSRFKTAGYKPPKPLLNLDGFKMIERVISNLMGHSVSDLILIMNDETYVDLKMITLRYPHVRVRSIVLDQITDGPASTVGKAKDLLDLSKPLLIANSDQLIRYPVAQDFTQLNDYDGIIWAMEDNSSKWSYVEMDEQGIGTNIKEKVVISPFATVGLYCFKKASDFFEALKLMKANADTVNDEYYVAPTYNYLFKNRKIKILNLGPISNVMFGLGTPEDYELFLNMEDRNQVYLDSTLPEFKMQE